MADTTYVNAIAVTVYYTLPGSPYVTTTLTTTATTAPLQYATVTVTTTVTMYGRAPVRAIINTPSKIPVLGTYVDTLGLIVAMAVPIMIIMVPAPSRKRHK